MTKSALCVMLVTIVTSIVSAGESQSPKSLEKKVAQLLAQMTLEEKVGQMTQVAIDVVSNEQLPEAGHHTLNREKLRTAIIEYHVGSIFNLFGSAYSVESWQEVITQIQEVATQETRLKIPVLYGIDAVHGANYTKDATIFPQSLGMAATWNPDLMKSSGEITANEIRACGIPWNFNPVLDVARQPLWPRLFETFGEDPYLVSTMGAAYVKGLEGENNEISRPDKVASCMKHYLGYSFPFSGKDRTPAYIPEGVLREYFLPSFKAAIAAGAHTIMINSSEINGVPVHSSPYYLQELLRDELGFKGLVVSDWHDIKNLHMREQVAASHKEAVRMAVMAGIDMSMVPLDFSFYDHLLELAKEGAVPLARIDEAVSRILKLKFELGLFENAFPNRKLRDKFASEEHRAVALQAARESLTLLKNESNLLPLGRNQKILVTGPTANLLSVLNSGWTITWLGDVEELYPKDKLTILEALEQKFGKENISFVPGVDFEKEIDIASAAEAAKKAQVAIVCLGEPAYCESAGNIMDLTLPEAQLRLAEAIQQTGTPVALVLAEGRPRVINRIVDNAGAVLMAYFPGMEGGLAIADVLAGDFNPCGKLPITYPRYPNDLTLYDHKISEGWVYGTNGAGSGSYRPEFAFGFGLSYTTFEYSNISVAQDTLAMGENVRVNVTVTNTGKLAGREVVQLYLSDLYASVTPHNKRLKRFAGVSLGPGESKNLEFTLEPPDLSFIGRDNKPVIEPGDFRIGIGNLSTRFTLLAGDK